MKLTSIRDALVRAICLSLTVTLLVSSTPAAPQTVVALAKESGIGLLFWYHHSRLGKLMQGRGESSSKPQEKQSDRDAKVTRLQIFPGNVTIDPGERVQFSAVASDAAGNGIGGIRVKWSRQGAAADQRALISERGEFESVTPGTFKVMAEANGQRAQINVVVRRGAKINANQRTGQPWTVSSRDVPNGKKISSAGPKTGNERKGGQSTAAKSERRSHARRARPSTPKPLLPEDSWGDDNYWSANQPGNVVGNPPGGPVDGGAGSGNFQFAAPVLSLPGRGINIALGLAYNSRLWNKADQVISYDNDRGWPAPGFSLGFGKMLGMGVYHGGMLVDADGTRHSYTGSVTPIYNGSHFVGNTTDGSFIDYSYQSGIGGSLVSGTAQLPNGTKITYGAPGPGAIYPTTIEDANGNFITITYVGNRGPQIQTISDTLGRPIQFYYDSNNLLTAVDVPKLTSGARTAVRLHYHQIALTTNGAFSGLTTAVRESNPWVLDAIYYPSTATGYWFNDSDSYSSYGMLTKVVEERGMSYSAETDTVTEGLRTRAESYNYPLTAAGLTDAPTYTSMTETWTTDGTNTDSATTSFAVDDNSSPRTVEITLPNGTKSKQYSNNHPGQFDDGLVVLDETRDSAGTLLQSSSTSNWEEGDYNSPRPTQVQATNNEINKSTTTTFSYDGTGCNQTGHYNQVFDVRNYGYGGELLRSTRTCYQNSTSYTNNHIFNLPTSVEIYGADNTTRVSRTEYQFDGQSLANIASVTMHDEAYDPYDVQNGQCYDTPDMSDPDCNGQCPDFNNPACDGYCPTIPYCPYVSTTDYRGNVTQITSYADAANLTGSVVETRRYDTTGNMVTASSSCCEQTSFSFTSDTQYAYPQTKTRGSATDALAQVTTSATYDLNTGLSTSTTDANGLTSTMSYNADTLRPRTATLATGAHTDYDYDDSAMTVTATTYLSTADGGGVADQNIKLLNGHGQVRQEKALGVGFWDIVDTVFDNMGQVTHQSRPYRSGDAVQSSTVTYDALGRTKTVIAPDGSQTQTFYNESSRPDVASANAGETTRVQDAWGRERWGRTDANGRLVEVVEPNPSGNGSVTTSGYVTTYAYNTLGNLTTINQGAQTRSFAYDSLGRLIAQKLAEQNATLNDAGTYIGSGTWSDVFTYDTRSNLTSRTDARGVKAIYTYNSDPLNRLQSVSWDASVADQNLQPTDPNYVVAAATVTYSYRAKTNPTDAIDINQLSSVSAASVSTESYSYNDGEGRVTSKTLTLSTRSNYPFVTDYIYDSLNRITDIRYPAEYGNGSQPRKVVHHNHDIASRLSSLTYDGQSFASNIAYNAASQTTSLNVGTGTNQITENYSYSAQTGLLDSQTVMRGGTPLLDLAYDYTNANGKRTGQLTKILNNLNHNKDRGYAYDALGRLIQATGGLAGSPMWTQTYSYDRYGNRLSVSASGNTASNRGNGRGPGDGSVKAARTSFRTPAISTESIITPAQPKVEIPTELLARNNPVDPTKDNNAQPRVKDASEPLSDSPPTLRAPAVPQNGPPTFTDDPLKDPNNPESFKIKAIHITELRYWINALRVRRGLSNYSWVKPTASGGAIDTTVFISWEPIDEMRTALDQAIGPPSPAYAGGLGHGLPVLANHITELRKRVKDNWGCVTLDQFIKNFYQGALARQPNANEFQSWDSQLRAASSQGHLLPAVQYMGRQIFKSTEYTNRGRSDHWYVYDLYWAYLQREPDASGWQWWESRVTADGRDNVRIAFETDGIEFAPKVAGLCVGSSGSSPVPLDGLASLTYDNATNRITTPGFEYDAAGNQTRIVRADGSGQQFQYDAANRLIQVRDDYGYVLEKFTYGDSNERLISDDGAYRTYFDCEGGATIAEYYESAGGAVPAWSKSYVYLGGRLLATVTPYGSNGEAIQYHHPDRLGTRLVTDPSTGSSYEQVTLPFGTALDAESTGATNHRFTTYDRSATTGVDYANNRHYDSQQGRFTQVDPAGMKATSLEHPQTLNLYNYVANDPVNRMDPSGMFWGAIKRFLHKVGAFLSKVAAAIGRVLNNRWVRIGVFILNFILPGIGGVFETIVEWSLKIYDKIAEIVSFMQLGGMVLQGHWKEFGITVAMGLASSMLTMVTSQIQTQVQEVLWPQNGTPQAQDLWDIFRAAVQGLHDGLINLRDTIASAFSKLGNLIPWYGKYCSSAATNSNIPGSGIDGADDGICRPHDEAYQTNLPGWLPKEIQAKMLNNIKRHADFAFFRHALFGFHSPDVSVFDIAFSGQYGGRPLIGGVYFFFAIPGIGG